MLSWFRLTTVVTLWLSGWCLVAQSLTPPVLSFIAGAGPVDPGERVTLRVYFSGNGAGQTYQWRKADVDLSGATSASFVIEAAAPTNAGTYSVVVSNSAGSSVATAELTLREPAAPAFTDSPVIANLTEGEATTFSFRVTGSFPRTYKWQRNGADIPGATQASYTLSSLALSDTGTYRLVVTNSLGSATSPSTSLTVYPASPPVLNAYSPYDQTIPEGGSLYLSVFPYGSTPFSYQWLKDGVEIPGATDSKLLIVVVTFGDAGKYSVRVTNVASSVTSRQATIVITPPVAPVFTSQPANQTLFVGESLRLSPMLTGSSPITYQWRRNGVAIAGATFPTYSVTSVTLAHAGEYSLVATNLAGTATTATAVVTVNPAIAPTVLVQPTPQTVNYNSNTSLAVQAAGSPPLHYAWSKDGVALPGQTASTITFNLATPADSGSYTVTVTGPGGSVTSVAAQLTVEAPALPVITQQPRSLEVAWGASAMFSVDFTTIGTGPLTYQWFKNGLPIPGATSSTYSRGGLQLADDGNYTVAITGLAGTVVSSAGRLTVSPSDPPRLTLPFAGEITPLTVGQSLAVGYIWVTGPGPRTYQWAKNGVPIPGATSSSYVIASAQIGDAGDYTCTIANEGGVITPLPFHVLPQPNLTQTVLPWIDAVQLGEIVYFLGASPARLERYDLANERWMTKTFLGETRTPTAFVPTPEGIYIAYGNTLVRRSPDLQSETSVLSTPANITHLFAFENYVYYGQNPPPFVATAYGAVNRATLQAGPAGELGRGGYGFRQVAFAPTLRKGFGRSIGVTPMIVETFSIKADGTLANNDPVYSDGMLSALRIFVSPNEQVVADDSGAVFSTSDLSLVGSVGEPLMDLAFFADSRPLALRGDTVTVSRADNFLPMAQATVPTRGLRLFVRGTDVFVFGAPASAGGDYAVHKIPSATLTPLAPPASAPVPARYSVDDAFVGADRVVHVFSRTRQALVRWSAVSRTFLSPLPLRAAPQFVFHQPGNTRAIAVYFDGIVTEVPLNGATTASPERILGVVSNQVQGAVDLGDKLVLNLKSGPSSADFRVLLGTNGDYRAVNASGYYGHGQAWLPGLRRLYSLPSYSENAIGYETVAADGTLPSAAAISNNGLYPPLRFNVEGTLGVSGDGKVVNADLALVGALGNRVLDGAWLANGLVSIRSVNNGTQLQQWSRGSYELTVTASLLGAPVRIFRLSDAQLVVVTNVQGAPAFTVLNDGLAIAATPSSPISFLGQTLPQAPVAAGAATFTVTPQGMTGGVTYEWARNGQLIAGATANTYTRSDVQPADAGLYAATVRDTSAVATSDPAILGVSTFAKVIGAGSEVGVNIVHQNGNTYDQVLLQGAAASATADRGQVLRVSFVDLSNDIVQVEFSGAGTLSLVLENPTGPAQATSYNQPAVSYMKGHAGIVITGADETTNVSVFSVGRATAVNPALFRDNVTYDGIADIAYLAIASANGKFGGVRAANAACNAIRGFTGLYAPGVQFLGPVYLGDVSAFDSATPMLVVGSVADSRITGGDLFQPNSQAVRVSGLSQLRFVNGTDSHGNLIGAQLNRARLENRGADVTTQIVVDP